MAALCWREMGEAPSSYYKEQEEIGLRAGSSVLSALKLIMEKACEDSLTKVFKYLTFLKSSRISEVAESGLVKNF